jgi:hypothetical protein
MCQRTSLPARISLLFLFGAAAAIAADEDEAVEVIDRTPEDCVFTNQIKDTDAIDDRTILFRMRGGGYLLNTLDNNCPGLERQNRFMYKSNGRLCDIDTITVLEQWAGALTPGFTCQLGQFNPISELEAQDLMKAPDEAAADANDIEVNEVVLPPGETEPVPASEGDD